MTKSLAVSCLNWWKTPWKKVWFYIIPVLLLVMEFISLLEDNSEPTLGEIVGGGALLFLGMVLAEVVMILVPQLVLLLLSAVTEAVLTFCFHIVDYGKKYGFILMVLKIASVAMTVGSLFTTIGLMKEDGTEHMWMFCQNIITMIISWKMIRKKKADF